MKRLILVALFLLLTGCKPEPTYRHIMAAGSELVVTCEGDELVYNGNANQIILICKGTQ